MRAAPKPTPPSATGAARRARLALSLVALLLSGCAMSDDKLAGMVVAPGKFTLYSCPELVTHARELTARRRELEGLMARAGTDTSGKLVSELAYRPDYVSVQGEMRDIREAAAEKNCDLTGADAAGAAASTGTTTSGPVAH